MTESHVHQRIQRNSPLAVTNEKYTSSEKFTYLSIILT